MKGGDGRKGLAVANGEDKCSMQHTPERQSCARVCEQTFFGVLLTRRTAAVVSVPTGASTIWSSASCTRTLGAIHATKGRHPHPAPEPGGAPPATALYPLARALPLSKRVAIP